MSLTALDSGYQTAVIHIGASSIGLLVGQAVPEQGTYEVIEALSRPVALGTDIFERGYIEQSTMEACTDALRTFLTTISETVGPGAMPENVYASNILAEARNEDVFINRISVSCGLEVSTLDDGEMTRLIYFMTQKLIKEREDLLQERTLVCHVGPGNTRVLRFHKGKIDHYHSYRLGGFRIAGALDGDMEEGSLLELIDGTMRGTLEGILSDYGRKGDSFVAIGGEIQRVASKVGEKKGNLYTMKCSRLAKFMEEIEGSNADELVQRFRTDYDSVEAMIPGIRAYHNIAVTLGAKRILVPAGGFDRELLEILAFRDAYLAVPIQQEVLLASRRLANRYQVDMAHAEHVEQLCVEIFEALRSLHQLDASAGLLLRVAAILHEVGRFVSARAHHQHSYYLIVNSEIFGLSRNELEIVSLVARYHRHSPPKRTHEGYEDLSKSDRLLVAKLASILRVADALERSHTQRVRNLQISLEDRRLEIAIPGVEDVSLEQLAVNDKGNLFSEIFGVDIELRAAPAVG